MQRPEEPRALVQRLSPGAYQALGEGCNMGVRLRHPTIGVGHFVAGWLQCPETDAFRTMTALGVEERARLSSRPWRSPARGSARVGHGAVTPGGASLGRTRRTVR
jgi:hypothetical protein